MKTERRHELQTNLLADHIGKYIQQVKPYSRHITTGILLLLAVVMAGLYFSNKWASERGAGWSDYLKTLAASDPVALEEVAEMHAGSTAALWARQSAGEVKVAKATIGHPPMIEPGQLFTDRKGAVKTLEEAKEHFLAVAEDRASSPQLVERARFGLAQVYECLSDTVNAQKYYDEIVNSSPDSALSKLAKRRSERLSEGSVQGWYNWFGRQDPAPSTVPPDGSGKFPNVSDDLDLLPDRPDLSFPGSSLSEQLKDIDLDAPLDDDTVEPMSTEPEEDTSATDDDEEGTAPESEGSPKPDDSTSQPEPTSEDIDSDG